MWLFNQHQTVLCIGWVKELHTSPELEAKGRRKRLDLVFQDQWGPPHRSTQAINL
jgi:hypothetical protein